MRLINSRGRVLLEVTSCVRYVRPDGSELNTLYSYTGDGCGGNTTLAGLHQTIKAIQCDAPSAKLTGLLPNPSLPFIVVNQ